MLLVFPLFFPHLDFMLEGGGLFLQGIVPSNVEEVDMVIFPSFPFMHTALPPLVHDSCVYCCSLIAERFD